MRFGLRRAVFVAATLALVSGSPALATDVLMPGKITIVKDTKLFKVVAKDPLKIPFPLPTPGGPGDPTVGGGDGNLQIIDTGSAGTLVDPLTQGAWQGLGNPAGSKGYKYKNLLAAAGNAAKIILVKGAVVKVVAKDDGSLNGPVSGNVGIILSVGTGPDRYCAEFGGSTIKNETGLVKRKDAGAPAACPGIAPCCNGHSFFNFATTSMTGDCGDIRDADGTLSANINCGGYYQGGGGHSFLLPFAAPDLYSPVMSISSCTGQVATVGPTTSTQTGGSNKTCTSAGCFFSAPMPLPNPASTPTSSCIQHVVAGAASGTVNCSTGGTSLSLPLSTILFIFTGDIAHDPMGTIPGIQSCPLCSGGTCIGGANNGMACTPGTTAINSSYPTSTDCPPDPFYNIGTIPIAFGLSSGAVSWTGTVATNDTGSPLSVQTRVFSGFCRDRDATGCFKGETSGVCPPTTPGSQQCWENGMAVGPACVGTFESCEQRNDGAFGPSGGFHKTITAIGSAASIIGGSAPLTLTSIFSVPPFLVDPSAATANATFDLPGPGSVALRGTARTCAAASPCP